MQKNKNRPGYKKTRFGWFPAVWQQFRISEIADIAVGRDLQAYHFSPVRTERHIFPVYSNTVAQEGLYGFYDFEEYGSNRLTVVGRGVGLGTAFPRVSGFGAIGRLLVIAPNSKKQFDVRFLAEYINHWLRIYNESSGIPQLPGESFSKYSVVLPSLPEQEGIAEVLECWDEAIRALELKIEKKRNIKKGLMQALLSGKRRLPGFGTTEGTENHGKGKLRIPAGWEKVQLDKMVTLRKKKFIPYCKPSQRCIELEHIASGTGRIIDTIKSTGLNSTKNVFSAGDVLFGKLRPNLRKYALPQFDGVCSSEIWVLTSRGKKLFNSFLFLIIQTAAFVRAANATCGSKMPRADWQHVSSTRFLLPSLPEQKAIVGVLSAADEEIGALERKLAGLREQKRFLLNNLVTGTIRLPQFRPREDSN